MTVEERLAALEARVQAAEDELAIIRLLNSYGPMVDSGASEAAAALWVEGGIYDFTGGAVAVAPDGLVAAYEGPEHQGLVHAGCSHLTATPRITLDGDRAEALAYSYVAKRREGEWFLYRAAINHWLLVRTDAGWRIERRTNRLLDGSEESYALLRRVLD
ncbi:MAG: nuclear transport factor 2 family protein [Novosphingobium sp.]|nr:nuclear transport factor 2 family protein [Novosphingobium sp.]